MPAFLDIVDVDVDGAFGPPPKSKLFSNGTVIRHIRPETVDHLRAEYADRIQQLRNEASQGEGGTRLFSPDFEELAHETLQTERETVIQLRNEEQLIIRLSGESSGTSISPRQGYSDRAKNLCNPKGCASHCQAQKVSKHGLRNRALQKNPASSRKTAASFT